MKSSSTMFTGWRPVILAVAIVALGSLQPAYCETDTSVLLLQQTPPDGGTITPETGVHHFGLNTYVTLTAVPKPGYQFVYWLGDVSDPMANTTAVYLDAPKIVIAIFERTQYEFLVTEQSARSAPIGGLIASPSDYARGGFTGRGRRRPRRWGWPSLPEPEEEPNDFPVPGEGDDFPVPVPEPATAALFALGSLICLRRTRDRLQKSDRRNCLSKS